MDRLDEPNDNRSQAGCPANGWREESMAGAPWRLRGFLKSLSLPAMSEFESLATPFWCIGETVLITEQEVPKTVLFLLEGRVRFSLNSIGGRRLALGIAEPGDILGLAAAVAGSPSEITAEAQYPCRVAAFSRRSFLDFLLRHPAASQNVAWQSGMEFKRACEQLRILGLQSTAQAKLARLLLEWCVEGQRTERGTRICCALTHGEIGEYIGVARETVSRTMAYFKDHALVEQHGSTLVISNLRTLQIYAGGADS
jgi:CRP-like cAMP-binding protein